MKKTFIFFSEYELCSKSFDTKAILTKKEINKERNVNSLQNMWCVKYIDTKSVFTNSEMNKKRNANSLKNMKNGKYIDTETVFTTAEINKERNNYSSNYKICIKVSRVKLY